MFIGCSLVYNSDNATSCYWESYRHESPPPRLKELGYGAARRLYIHIDNLELYVRSSTLYNSFTVFKRCHAERWHLQVTHFVLPFRLILQSLVTPIIFGPRFIYAWNWPKANFFSPKFSPDQDQMGKWPLRVQSVVLLDHHTDSGSDGIWYGNDNIVIALFQTPNFPLEGLTFIFRRFYDIKHRIDRNWPVSFFLPFFTFTFTHHTYIEIMGWFGADSEQAAAYDQVGCLHPPSHYSMIFITTPVAHF